MGGIWEDRSDVNRGVPSRTARYGTGATCRFSVSGGRGLARAALGVKGSQVRILSSRPIRGSLTVEETPRQRAFFADSRSCSARDRAELGTIRGPHSVVDDSFDDNVGLAAALIVVFEQDVELA